MIKISNKFASLGIKLNNTNIDIKTILKNIVLTFGILMIWNLKL